MEGKIANLFFETLLEEMGIVRVSGCSRDDKKRSHLGGLKKSTNKICAGGSSWRTRKEEGVVLSDLLQQERGQ